MSLARNVGEDPHTPLSRRARREDAKDAKKTGTLNNHRLKPEGLQSN